MEGVVDESAWILIDILWRRSIHFAGHAGTAGSETEVYWQTHWFDSENEWRPHTSLWAAQRPFSERHLHPRTPWRVGASSRGARFRPWLDDGHRYRLVVVADLKRVIDAAYAPAPQFAVDNLDGAGHLFTADVLLGPAARIKSPRRSVWPVFLPQTAADY